MEKIDLWEGTQAAFEKWPNSKKYWYEVVGEEEQYLEDFYYFIECLNNSSVKTLVNRIKQEAPSSFKGKLAVCLSKIVGKNEDYLAYFGNQSKVLYFIENIRILLGGADYSYDLTLIDVAFMKVMKSPREFQSISTLMSKRIVNIIQSRGINGTSLQSTIINGILNAPLFDIENSYQCDLFLNYLVKALNKDYILYQNEIMVEVEYLLECPTLKHCELIHAIVNSPSIVESNLMFEFCDEALTIEESQIDEMLLHIQNKLVKKEMSFAEAMLNYNKEAMKILETSKERLMPNTIVTINTYESEIPNFKKTLRME